MQGTTGMSVDEKGALDSAMSRIETLKALRSNDIISEDDFLTRRDQIINELTGTTADQSTRKGSLTSARTKRLSSSRGRSPSTRGERFHKGYENVVRYHAPPEWEKLPSERAVKVQYSFEDKNWIRRDVKVKIDTQPFDKGGLRLVFHLLDESDPETKYVAKMSKDPRDNATRTVYFNDVRMQATARHFAERYNQCLPPKKVEFIAAFVLQLVQREGSPVCGVERFISGNYKKYNNNKGWISDEDRNTPAAFCHFSYESSNNELLICDIQGVGDVYTDPQIHSKDGDGFGKGNLGREGMDSFLTTHRCNAICRFLKLKNFQGLPIGIEGTLPARTFMPGTRVPKILGGNTPLLFDSSQMGFFPPLEKGKQEKACCCSML